MITMPKKIDLDCYKGQTWARNIYITEDGDPVDLTGCTAASQIRPAPNSEELTKTITCTVDGAEGTITMSLSSADTAALIPGNYAYDLQVTDGGGDVDYYIYGIFMVKGRVTV
jgi:hypothetical protein